MNMENKLSQRKLFIGILIIGILLRIYICFFSSLPNMHKDSYEYYNQAETLLKGGYTNYFPNGYPLIIAMVKRISLVHTNQILLWLNILFSGLTIVFINNIGKRISGNWSVGLAAAGILAIFPS